MAYDFDTIIERQHTWSYKWDARQELFGKDVLPLWVADMDFAVAPPIIHALQKRLEHPIFGYSIRPTTYNQAMIEWYQKRHDWTMEPEWILETPGVVPALYYAVQAFTKPGDKVLLFSPIYRPFYHAVEQNGRIVVASSLVKKNSRYTLDFADLKAKIGNVKLILFCSPHNPVGRVWEANELEALIALCLQHDVILLSDEIHCDIVYPGFHHIPTASISAQSQRIMLTCISPSKTFNIPSMQNATVVVQDPKLRAAFAKILQQNAVQCTNILSLIAGEAAYRHGAEWLDAVLVYLGQNRVYLQQYLNQYLPQIQCTEPEGTFLAWLDFSKFGLTHAQLKQFLIEKANLGLEDGLKFGIEGNCFYRLNFACPKRLLTEALDRLCRIREI